MKSASTKNEKTVQNLEVVESDLNNTVNDMNSSLVEYELNATKQSNKILVLTTQNEDLLKQIAELKSKLNQLNDVDNQNQKKISDSVEAYKHN